MKIAQRRYMQFSPRRMYFRSLADDKRLSFYAIFGEQVRKYSSKVSRYVVEKT